MIKLILVLLIIFTPLSGGSVDFWAFSSMELALLLILLLWAVGQFSDRRSVPRPLPKIAFVMLFLFLGLALLQMIPLPGEWVDLVSPRTFELRGQLRVGSGPLEFLSLSLFSYATKVEFFKWVILAGFFLFFLYWRLPGGSREIRLLIVAILAMGTFEAFYGLFGFFGVQNRILPMEGTEVIHSVMGTFVNRNHFAAYLLMIIPLGIGFLCSREIHQRRAECGRLHRFTSLDGKGLLIGFGIIVMVLALLFSGSRMGILSLLLSFVFVTMLFKGDPEERFLTKKSILILALALFWGASIGLDAVISRFSGSVEDFETRRMIWSDTLHIIKEFPLWGSGLGTFSQVFPMYRSFHLRGMVTHAENDFLQLTSETGFVGIALLLVLFLVLFAKAATGIRSFSAGAPQRYIGIGGLVGILALMLHSQAERNMQIPANAFLYTLLWGIVLRLSPEGMKKEKAGKKP